MSKSASFAGNLARRLVRSVVRLYYPDIVVTHGENIPRDGPVLLLANHANSLIDPVIVGIAAGRPVHFMAKAPLFDIPVFGYVLRALGMIPAYRGADDQSQVGRNLKSLADCAEYLVAREAVGLFPEGKSHDALKVDKVRSGAARIAIQAVKCGTRDLLVVPLGINFEQKERFRSSVWVRVAEPIRAGDLLQELGEDERRVMRTLTAEITGRLKGAVIHLNEETWEPFVDDLEILRPPPRDQSGAAIAALRQRKRIADAMNYFLAADRPRAEAAAAAIREHRDRLASSELTMRSTILRMRGLRCAAQMIWQLLWTTLAAIPALAGILHHIVPFLLNRTLARRLQAPGHTTVALTRLVLGVPIYSIWYAFVWWGVSRYFLPWVAWTWIASMPLAGVFALTYCRRLRQNSKLWWKQFKILFAADELATLRRQRNDLLERLEAMAREFARLDEPEQAVASAGAAHPKWWPWALGLLVSIGVLVGMLIYSRPGTLPELDSGGLALDRISVPVLIGLIEADERILQQVIEGVDALEAQALAVREAFGQGQRSYYRQADNDMIRHLLLRYINYRTALLRIIWKYQGVDEIREEPLRLRAFLLELGSASVLYETSLKFVTQFRHPEAVRKLNEAEPLYEVPSGFYDQVRENLLNGEHRKRLAEAFERYQRLQSDFARLGLGESSSCALFHSRIRQAANSSDDLIPILKEERLKALAAEVSIPGKRAVYETRSLVSTWIGDTRVRGPRRGQALIRPAQVSSLRPLLRPGDILIERRNWYLSNAFLPGFWPHSALYVGTPEELQQMKLHHHPAVQKHWKKFSERDAQGHERVIIESVSEGVVFTTLEHSIGGADYAAFLRPRCGETQIRECIVRAFQHVDKPYDFEFDFFTTDKLVCTELIYRTYDGVIDFPLVTILGTRTLPAIELVRKFVNERAQPDPQLDFVAFLDGDETKGTATFKDVPALAETLQRPALTWLQTMNAR